MCQLASACFFKYFNFENVISTKSVVYGYSDCRFGTVIRERLNKIGIIIFKLLPLLSLYFLYCCDSNIDPDNTANALWERLKNFRGLGNVHLWCLKNKQRSNLKGQWGGHHPPAFLEETEMQEEVQRQNQDGHFSCEKDFNEAKAVGWLENWRSRKCFGAKCINVRRIPRGMWF